MPAGSEDERQERRERLLRCAVFSALAGIVAFPAYMYAASGEIVWAAVGAAILAASAASYAQVFLRVRRDLARARRLGRMTGRILSLCQSLPRGSEVETLAVLHEIRACYGEAFKVAERLGDGGKRVMPAMREAVARVDEIYDIQSGSLRRTEANAAEFAAAMRAPGREEADGSETRGAR